MPHKIPTTPRELMAIVRRIDPRQPDELAFYEWLFDTQPEEFAVHAQQLVWTERHIAERAREYRKFRRSLGIEPVSQAEAFADFARQFVAKTDALATAKAPEN